MGWIKIDRNILNSSLWQQDEPYDCRSAYIDLLLNAYFADIDIPTKHGVVHAKKGQYFTTIVYLSKRWKWSRNKVYRFLRSLDGTALGTSNGTVLGTPSGTLLTLMGYGFAEGGETTLGTPLGTSLGTSNGTLNKNIKNLKEVKEEKNRINNSKTAFGRNQNVYLTGEEIGKLIDDFGYEAAMAKIETESAWKVKKGAEIDNDYSLIRKWLACDKEKGLLEKPKPMVTEKPTEPPPEEEEEEISDEEWLKL